MEHGIKELLCLWEEDGSFEVFLLDPCISSMKKLNPRDSERSCLRSPQTAPSGSWPSAVQVTYLDLLFLTIRTRLQVGTHLHDQK